MHTVDTKPFFCGCGCGLPGNKASQTLVETPTTATAYPFVDLPNNDYMGGHVHMPK